MATEIPTGNRSADLESSMAGAREGVRSALDRGMERGQQLKDAAFERASHLRDQAMERGRTAMSAIERTIDERPLMVLGGVFAGGLILGLLLNRK